MTLVNPNNVDFLSARVTNYQYNPFIGALPDQLQIHPHLSSPRLQTSAQQRAARRVGRTDPGRDGRGALPAVARSIACKARAGGDGRGGAHGRSPV